jgi:hypothetical protein
MQKKSLIKFGSIAIGVILVAIAIYLFLADTAKHKQPEGTSISLKTPSKEGALDNPIVFYMEKSADGKCTAKQRDVSKGPETEITVLSQLKCPDNIVWDYQHQKFFLIVDKTLWVQGMDESKPTNLGALPVAEISMVWIDDASKNIRIGYMVPVPPQDVVVSPDGKIDFKFEGKQYPATFLPPVGNPFLAVVSELKKDKWERVIVEPTKSGAAGTPGISVLDVQFMQAKKPVNLKDLLIEATCAGGKLECNSDLVNAVILIGKKDGYGYIPSRFDNATAFGVMNFDEVGHATEPVYFCKTNCLEGIKLQGIAENERLALSSRKDEFLLVTEEGTGKHPRIYRAGDGKPMIDLPNAFGAVWLP